LNIHPSFINFLIHLLMKICCFLLCLLPAVVFSQGQRWYVHATATGQNTGTNWPNAFAKLQDALAAAQAGDEVWVAKGVYRPTDTLNRNLSFEPRSGVRLYGGFLGTESALTERDWLANPTTLSGDIGVKGDSTDNSYNVVYWHQPDSNSVLDGFILTNGVADYNQLSNARDRRKCGGGLYINGEAWEAYPNVLNCTFRHNTARNFGGGAMINGAGDGSVSTRFFNCRFEYNHSLQNGGGIYWYAGAYVERGVDVDSCVFEHNLANSSGGGMCKIELDGIDTFCVNSSNFTMNTSKELNGGGIYFLIGRSNTYSSTEIISSEFNDNHSGGNGISVLISPFSFQTVNRLIIANNKFHAHQVTNELASELAILYVDLLPFDNRIQTIRNLIFSNNKKPRNLMVLINDDKVNKIDSLLVINNEYLEGGIECETDTVKISNLFYSYNTGLAMYYSDGRRDEKIVKNSMFAENVTKIGILVPSDNENSIDYINCTFYNNDVGTTSTNPLSYPQNVRFHNCIIDDPDDINKYFLSKSGSSVEHSSLSVPDCSALPSNVTCGPGNLFNVDPQFRDTANGDFTLLPCSPLINAGNNNVLNLPLTDLNGDPRIQEGTVDMGAYEHTYTPGPDTLRVQAACAGAPNGGINWSLAQGCLPIQYIWTDAQGNTGTGIDSLPAGEYRFTFTDARGRVNQQTILVPGSAPTVSISGDTLLCGTGTTGELTALPGGLLQTPVTFLWNTNDMDPTISGLTTGLYTVTLTDAIGCADSAQTTLTVVDAPESTSAVTNATHVDSLNGRIDFAITSGVGPYTYVWDTGDSTASISGLAQGTYTMLLTDGAGCTYGYVFDVGVTSGTVNPGSKMSGRVWPNPVNDVLYLHFPAPELVAGIQLTDALGRLVYTGDQWVPIIHMVHLPEGVYCLVIRQSNGAVFSEKVVVQR